MAQLNFSNRRRLPVILQADESESGLACLAMVAGYYGHEIDLLSLRRKYMVSLKGLSLNHLMATAAQMDLSPRPLRVDLDRLTLFKCPMILNWDLNHFVVLKKVRDNRAVIHDPAKGILNLPFSEVSKHLTGVGLEFAPTERFQPRVERQRLSVWQLWIQHTGIKSTLVQIFIFSLALEIFAIASPLFMQLVVDQVLVAQDRNLLVVLGVGFLLLALVTVAVTGLRSWVILYLSTHLNFHMVSRLFRHMLKLPMDYFEQRHIGDVVSRFNSLHVIQHKLTTNFVETIVDGIMIIGTLAVMFVYSALLTAVAIIIVVGYGLTRHFMYRPLYRTTQEHITRIAKQQSHFLETVRGVQSIKLFGNEVIRHSVWQNLFADTVNAQVQVSKLSIIFKAVNGTLYGVGNVVIIWLGALAILNGNLSIGMLLAFVSYKGQVTGKSANLIEQYIQYRMLALHSERVADIALSEPDEPVGNAGLIDFYPSGEVRLDDLSFRYSDHEKPVLQQLNLRIGAGESVAIVGRSGCGKTTLVKLMLGLLRPKEGKILIDGIDIRRLGVSEYRKWVGAVMQEDRLFAGSLADNISFSDPRPDDNWIKECAQIAAIHQDIVAMPTGYNTLVGDMGAALSGGQRQRVFLARALYRRPKILLLDEATSHLDLATEARVVQAIQEFEMTRIIVAHRPETAKLADRTIELANEFVPNVAPLSVQRD